MTTAISIPDTLFDSAEQRASKLGISRSELYTAALEQYLSSPSAEETSTSITEQLNGLYSREDSKLDPILVEIQARSLPEEEW